MVVTTRAHSETPSTPKLVSSPSTPSSSSIPGPSRSSRTRTTPKPSTPLSVSITPNTSHSSSRKPTRRTPRPSTRTTSPSGPSSIERGEEEDDEMDVFVELPRIKGLDTHALSMTKDRFLPALPGTTGSTMDSSAVEVLQQAEKGEGRAADDGEREITPMVERSDGMEGSSSDTIAQDAEEEEEEEEEEKEEEVVRGPSDYETLVIDQEEEDKDDSSSSSASDSDSDSDSADDSESDSSSTITSPSSPSSIPDLNLLLAAALQTASTTAAQKAREREERNVFGDDVMKLEQVVKERPIPGLQVPSLPKKLLNIQAAKHPKMKDIKGKGKAREEGKDDSTMSKGMEIDDGVYVPQLTKGQKKKLPRTQSANSAWSSLPTIPSALLPQMKRDYQALSLGNSLDPKRFMKGGEKGRGKVPEKFAIGTLITPSRRLATSTIETVQTYQPGSIVKSLVGNDEMGGYAKRKFGELQGKRMENGRNNGWKKRKGGW